MLLAALLGAVTFPLLAGKPEAGTPVAQLIAGPPAVGSCVSGLTYPDPTLPAAGAARTLPVATVVPCAGEVMGEIMSVTRSSGPSGVSAPEPDGGCRSQVEGYLGTTPTTDILGVQWNKNLDVDTVTVGPNAHDRAAGRTWTACVLSPTNQLYRATALRSSWSAGRLPDAFGLCWAENLVQHGVPTNCVSPHRTQQLGYGFVASTARSAPSPADPSASDPSNSNPAASDPSAVASADPAAVAAGCAQLAATMMKAQDPTRGGLLAVKVVADTSGAPFVQCAVAVVGNRKLTGSLIGIGNKPLPLT